MSFDEQKISTKTNVQKPSLDEDLVIESIINCASVLSEEGLMNLAIKMNVKYNIHDLIEQNQVICDIPPWFSVPKHIKNKRSSLVSITGNTPRIKSPTNLATRSSQIMSPRQKRIRRRSSFIESDFLGNTINPNAVMIDYLSRNEAKLFKYNLVVTSMGKKTIDKTSCLAAVVQEVRNKNGKKYPDRTIQIVNDRIGNMLFPTQILTDARCDMCSKMSNVIVNHGGSITIEKIPVTINNKQNQNQKNNKTRRNRRSSMVFPGLGFKNLF